jgi:hypothetical protein
LDDAIEGELIGLAGELCELLGHKALKRGTHIVDVARLIGRDAGHHETALATLDQSLGLEFAQGLPQGRAADVQFLAEILLDKPRARLQGSRLHGHAQAGGNLSAQGRSFLNKGSKARFGNI